MKKIVHIKFGSHLYGTATENSDIDLKSVYIPNRKDIILQRVTNSISNKRNKPNGEKNLPDEVDEECFSLQRYLSLLGEGQTVALDMLFANQESLIESNECWKEICANKDKLVSKKSAAFVGYCRQQANKYGIKGSRVHAVRQALTLLEAFMISFELKMESLWHEVEKLCEENEHMTIVDITQAEGNIVPHWEIVGRKFGKTTSIKQVYNCLRIIMDNYGKRALKAEAQEGVDWKALSHAVRVANQAIELFDTGNIIFPLTNAKHILEIKLGKLPYQKVANEIEQLLEDVEKASQRSNLREHPDYDFIDDFVLKYYGLECTTS